jgi:hypothetical protein
MLRTKQFMNFECSINFRENTNSLWHEDWISIENRAQIVPVKVKYFQTVPNETINKMKN